MTTENSRDSDLGHDPRLGTTTLTKRITICYTSCVLLTHYAKNMNLLHLFIHFI